MAYVSLYRKYRPQTFEDVVGQEHVTTTLRNSVQEGRVASGYLFTGTRGTAKTTCARILAKALNCIGPDGKRDVPNPEPCSECGPCKSIAASSFVDVLEMDAASHGKVDDVRDLVASIKFPPMEGRYKVYIIDEAHQLSRDAMDAFLKTLEEPPDRVVFVLATTELEKLPITIASRCQVYEFKRGSIAQISSRLADVLKAEKVKADPAAITLIARAADGSYRDSLSLLEQVLAYQRQHVRVKDVTVVLGTIDEDVLSHVVDLIADSDAAGAFALAGTLLESGKDVRQFLKSLAERFRDMLFIGVGARPVAPGEIDDTASLRAQAARFAPAALLNALEVVTAAEQEVRRSNQHRLLLEMALLRLMRLPSEAAVPPAFDNGVAVHTAIDPAPLLRSPEERLDAPDRGGETERLERGNPAPTGFAPVSPLSEAGGEPTIPYEMPPPLADEELSDLEDDAEADALDLTVLLPGDEDLDLLPAIDDQEDTQPSLIVVAPEPYDDGDDLLSVQQVAFEPPVITAAPPAPPTDAAPEVLRLQKNWQEVVNRMSNRPATAAFLREGRPIALNGSTILIKFPSQASVDKLENSERGRQIVEDAINKTLDVAEGTFRIKATLHDDPMPSRGTALGKTVSGKVAQGVAPASRGALTPPVPDKPSAFVDEVIAVFGGRLLDDDAR